MAVKKRSSVSATRFRAHLFDYLKQARAGREITVQHKDSSFRIVPVLQPSKLERLDALPHLDAINGTWEEFVEASEQLSGDLKKTWRKKWDRRLAD